MKYRHSVIFGNPYREPPLGFPKILVALETESHRPPDRFEQKRIKILDRLDANNIKGFHLGFDYEQGDDFKKRTWSDEAKKKNRLRRLRKRMSKKYSIPELLEEAIQEEIAKNPTYYQ